MTMAKTKVPRTKRTPHIPQVEPIIVRGEELRERLLTYVGTTEENVDAVMTALNGLGLRVVENCQLCAEAQGARIPACPNVAAWEVSMTHGSTIFGGTLRVCLPHARGEKVHAPSRRDAT